LQFKSSAISKNVNSFLKNVVQKTFGKKQALICHQVIICKEDRELLTKSQIVVLTQIFNLLNQALETVISQGGDQQLVKWIGQCLDGLESGMCASHSQKSSV
jgi:type II secretory pathway component PulF